MPLEVMDTGETVVLDGGPMDGQEHTAEPGVDALSVVMSDGQQHRYERTAASQARSDGRTARVFTGRGRYDGPR
jgi:hypothetical protein